MEIDVESCLNLMKGCAVAIFFEERRQREQQRHLAPRVKSYILTTLMNEHRKISLERAASACAVSAPTLRRKLRRENTSFQQLADEVRADLAKDLLRSGATIDEIAECLGMATSSSFSRAFKEWTGLCPLHWVQNELGLPRERYRRHG